jgi:ATP-dependent Clp protease protease subunit
MIHQPLAGMQGSAEEIMIHRKELRRVKDRLNKLQVKHTGQTLEYIEEHTDRDNFMTADEAKEFNLIDHVVSSLSEIPG